VKTPPEKVATSPTPVATAPATATAKVNGSPKVDPPSKEPVPRMIESEIALLRRAQQALGMNPTRALALAGQHRRDYPSSKLAQEREFIEIEALLGLGRMREASLRVQSFRSRYPKSAHLRRLQLISPSRAREPHQPPED
jgi:hypothetical protein